MNPANIRNLSNEELLGLINRDDPMVDALCERLEEILDYREDVAKALERINKKLADFEDNVSSLHSLGDDLANTIFDELENVA